MTLLLVVTLAAIYALFLLWYGGSAKPLRQDEIDRFMNAFGSGYREADEQAAIDDMRALLANDDGREFVMHNLVRHRPKALYPPGLGFGDDARAADQRYGKAIVWPLLRFGNLPIFIARRCGDFIEPEGADRWHYVALVRYRSRRDFLRFVAETDSRDIFIHKWAAIEKTHVFPVRPIVSLVFVRGAVAALLALLGFALHALLS